MENNWLHKYNSNHDGESSQQDNRDEFDLFMELSEFDVPVDTDKAWNQIHKKIIPKRNYSVVFYRIAAILVLGLSMTFAIYTQQDVIFPTSQTHITAKFEVKKHVLPDGTEVTLSPASSVNYLSQDFSEERRINLKGEAFFDVTKSSAPFTIHSKSGTVRVLGTSFNLNASDRLDLFVTSGLVEVQTEQDKAIVKPGQRALATSNGDINVTTYNGANLISWSTGSFKFENETLESVIPYLERYYDIKFHASKAIRNCKITAEFNQMELVDLVNVITTILNAESNITDKKVKISGEGCN